MKNILYITFLATFFFLSSCEEDSVDDYYNEPCGTGYTGYDCSEQITPYKITISSVVVKSFPPTSDGLSAYPDISMQVSNSTSSWGPPSSYYENALPTGSYTFYPNFSYYNAFDNITIRLYDYDFLLGAIIDEDYMGGVVGPLYNQYNNFPNKVDFDYGLWEFDVYLSYQWL